MSGASRAMPEDSDRVGGVRHPRRTTTLFGHAGAERDLLEAYRSGRLPHAWLIGGPEGIGKATLAWRFARFLLAYPDPKAPQVVRASDLSVPGHEPAVARTAGGAPGDIVVLRREWNDKSSPKRLFGVIRVDDVRRAAGLFQQASRAGGYRICILDSADDLNRESANALLKLVEEPPPLSLFVVVAHRPARLLPTLRSRCRTLHLRGLATGDVVRALRDLQGPWADKAEGELAAAGERAGGSVGGAIHLLGGERLALDRSAAGLLDGLPNLDWGGVHRLGDRLGSDPDDFDIVVAAMLDWLHARVAAGVRARDEGRRLAPLTEVWEKLRRSARDTQALNLDKRAFLFAAFADIAQALPPS